MTMWRLPGPPFGFWSNGPDGEWPAIFFEDPPSGTYVAPTTWLPMTEPYTHVFGYGTTSHPFHTFTVGRRHSPVRGTAFDPWAVARAACGTRRSVAVTAVGPSVVP